MARYFKSLPSFSSASTDTEGKQRCVGAPKALTQAQAPHEDGHLRAEARLTLERSPSSLGSLGGRSKAMQNHRRATAIHPILNQPPLKRSNGVVPLTPVKTWEHRASKLAALALAARPRLHAQAIL